MTEPAPILVVFGIDPEGKPRASRFADEMPSSPTKQPRLLGFRSSMDHGRGRPSPSQKAAGTGTYSLAATALSGSSGSRLRQAFCRCRRSLSPQYQRRRRSDDR